MRNNLSQSSSEVPVVTIEHKDSSKRDIYPEIRSDYTYRVGSLFEELIRESIEDMGFDTELKEVNTEGVDIDTEDKKIGIEAWNWSSEHSYLKREESVLHNLRPYIVRILFASFINEEAKQRITSYYKEDPVIVKEIGYQVLPKGYYDFYKKYDRLDGKRFVSKRLKKELKNIIKSTVINAIRERGHKFNMEVDGPHLITTYNKEELKERKKKTVDCYIPTDGYVYSYCDLTSNDLTNTSNTSEVTSGLKNKGKTRLRIPSNDKDLLCKAGSPVPENTESPEAIPGVLPSNVKDNSLEYESMRGHSTDTEVRFDIENIDEWSDMHKYNYGKYMVQEEGKNSSDIAKEIGVPFRSIRAWTRYKRDIEREEEFLQQCKDDKTKPVQVTFPWYGSPKQMILKEKVHKLIPSCKNCYKYLRGYCPKTGIDRIRCLKSRVHLFNISDDYHCFNVNRHAQWYEEAIELFWSNIRIEEEKVCKTLLNTKNKHGDVNG